MTFVIYPEYFVTLLISVIFIISGYYMPRTKQNYTFGIKVVWALNDEENWDKTHRLAGKVWMGGGLLMLLSLLLPKKLTMPCMLTVLLIVCFVPVIYSYLFHRKKMKSGQEIHSTTHWPPKGSSSWYGKFGKFIPAAVLVILGIIMFTGNINVVCHDKDFSIEASYWQDLTIEYTEISDIEYRDYEINGSRVGGFGSARLLMGTFENDEFGYYTRYTYTGCDASIVIKTEDDTFVISGKNPAETEAVYEELSNRMNQN